MNRVIVVGAGPVGLVTALRLASLDVPVLVLEAADALADDLRASTWHPPTLDMLDEYGLGEALVARGRITPTWQVRLHETGERAEFDLAVLADHTRHPYRLQCEQRVFCRLVLERLAAAGVEVRFGARVTAATQDDDGVCVTLADGSTERGRYLIGADGARSAVREAFGIAFEGSAYPETTILVTTTYPFERRLAGLSGVNYVWKGASTYSLLRLPDLWRCSFHPRAGETPEDAIAPAAIQAQLRDVTGEDGPFEVHEVRPYRVHQRIAATYRAGRVLLVGDAAHLNSPKGGMGMNGGIHDAFNLTEKLARIWHEGADEALLDLYSHQRRAVATEEIIAQADRNRARMNESDEARRRAMLRELQAIAADPERRLAHLLKTSMIAGLERARAIT